MQHFRRHPSKRGQATQTLKAIRAVAGHGLWFEGLEQRSHLAVGTPGADVNVTASTTLNEAIQAVGYASNGSSVVLYSQVQPPALAPRTLFAQRYGADGQSVGSAIQINAGLLNSNSADMAVLPDGRFVVVWDVTVPASGPIPANLDVYARMFNADATPVGNAFVVSDNTSLDQAIPEVAASASGMFAVAWIDDASNSSRQSLVRAQLFDNAGTPIGASVQVNPLPQQQGIGVEIFGPDIAMDADGDFAVGWVEERSSINDDDGTLISNNVFSRRVSSAGQVHGDVISIASLDPDLDTALSVQMAMDSAGNFVVGYNNKRDRVVNLGQPDESYEYFRSEIYYRSVSVNDFVTQPVTVELTDNTFQIPPLGYRTWDLTLDSSGNVVAAWIINVQSGSSQTNSVWMRRFSPLDQELEPAFRVTGTDSIFASTVSAATFTGDGSIHILAAYNSFVVEQSRSKAVLRKVPVLEADAADPNAPNLAIDLTGVWLGRMDAASTPLIPGDRLTLQYSLSNASLANQIIKGSVSLNFYLSDDDKLDKFDTALLSKAVVRRLNIKAGVVQLLRTTVTLPANVQPGSKRIILALSDSSLLPTSNQVDNTDASGALSMVWQFGQVGLRKNVRLTLNDADGTRVNFTMPGAGTGEVQPGESWSVNLTNTTALSAASIGTSKTRTPGDDGKVILKAVTLTPAANTPGPIGLRSLSAPSSILDGALSSSSSLGIRSITFGEIRSGDWNVSGAVDTLSINGNAKLWTLTAPQINTLNIRGLLDNARIILFSSNPLTGDNLGSMSVGAIRDSYVLVQVMNSDTLNGLPSAADIAAGSIRSFTVRWAGKSLPAGVAAGFTRSVVSAASLGSMRLTSVQLDPAPGTEVGLVATQQIKSFVRNGIKLLKNLTTPNTGNEDYDPATSVRFVVRILPTGVG